MIRHGTIPVCADVPLHANSDASRLYCRADSSLQGAHQPKRQDRYSRHQTPSPSKQIRGTFSSAPDTVTQPTFSREDPLHRLLQIGQKKAAGFRRTRRPHCGAKDMADEKRRRAPILADLSNCGNSSSHPITNDCLPHEPGPVQHENGGHGTPAENAGHNHRQSGPSHNASASNQLQP